MSMNEKECKLICHFKNYFNNNCWYSSTRIYKKSDNKYLVKISHNKELRKFILSRKDKSLTLDKEQAKATVNLFGTKTEFKKAFGS